MASQHGHAKSQYNLGCMYDHGAGVVQDTAEAIRLWKSAAAQGHERAHTTLEQNAIHFPEKKGKGFWAFLFGR